MASADHKVALKKFPSELKRLLDKKSYLTEQVFNRDEISLILNWKPDHISKDKKKVQGFMVAKDSITLLLCSNSASDFITKPKVLYKSFISCALKNKNSLPVF